MAVTTRPWRRSTTATEGPAQEAAAPVAGETTGSTTSSPAGSGCRSCTSCWVSRSWTPLPPWADALSHVERTLEGWLEKALIVLLFLIQGSGLLLIGTGEDHYLPLHVAAHIAFFVAVGLHVALVLKHPVIQRDRHLARML
jgi:cytochrome b561